MDHDQLFKAVLSVQLAPFMELFFPAESIQLDLVKARFVDKEIFAAPPAGPGRELDLLADVPLCSSPVTGSPQEEPAHALVALHIEVQAQRELTLSGVISNTMPFSAASAGCLSCQSRTSR